MEQLYITDVKIKKVRHLENIQIPLAKDKRKHLIFTGKNGSGKTSVLEEIAIVFTAPYIADILETEAISIEMNKRTGERALFGGSVFVVAYYQANRIFETKLPKHVEKIELRNYYAINERPRENFVKYLLDLKMTEALAATGGKTEKAQKIKAWFANLEQLLRKIFEDDTLHLCFDEDTFQFTICEKGKEPFDFNSLSSGYAAVLDIVVDLIIRMEKQTEKTFQFDIPGIVLIDEIETHLHLELQKKILELLTTIFPNIQFIVSTHSPFILNSLDNVVIYDLENHLLVEHGLSNVPYSGIVEGYFGVDKMSVLLRKKYEQYKELVQKTRLSDEDLAELARLEMFLDEIPDYLALDIATEYKSLKLELENREDY